jgi:GTP cyclohydrolase I
MTTKPKPRTDAIDESGMTDILSRIFGENVWDDDVSQTAKRWLKAMQEFTPQKTMPFKFTVFPASVNQLIVVCGIQFASLCAHHLFPFVGECHVGYIPNRKQVGLSKIPRLVHWFATQPQSQEKLTSDIATFLKHELEAMGVAVVIEATHTCMSARGVREHNGIMRTSEMRGLFLTASEARNEFLTLIGRSTK